MRNLHQDWKFWKNKLNFCLSVFYHPLNIYKLLVSRGALHRKLGDFNAAIDDFLLALDKCDHDEDSPVYTDSQRQLLLTYNDFAVECFTKGFYEEAIILLNKAIKGEKREKGLYVNRGGKLGLILKLLHYMCRDKNGLLGFRPGLTQTGLCSYRRLLEA